MLSRPQVDLAFHGNGKMQAHTGQLFCTFEQSTCGRLKISQKQYDCILNNIEKRILKTDGRLKTKTTAMYL